MTNITFHGVGDIPAARPSAESGVWLPIASFEAILDALCGASTVRITFDDGNASDARIALPALARRGLAAQFYVCPGLLDREGYLSTAELRSLLAAGMAIGSHGMLHRPWRRLPAAELHREVFETKDRLEQLLGVPIRQAACPFGAYDRRTLGALAEAGFQRVYTSDGGPATADAWLQPRNTVHRGDDPAAVIRWHQTRRLSLWRAIKLQVKRWR
jgi:peptidoglycan/xylan/chitin deacetylase (PgdA/CDA1 family)